MRRLPDWSQRLAAAIRLRRRTPHQWGLLDCALCAADLVAAQTGHDFGTPFRGRYTTEIGARRVLRSLGYADLGELADACLPRGIGRPRRGDIVLQPHASGDFLATAWGGGVVGPGPQGLGLVPLAPGAVVWRVG